jgi:hypothetical protein
MVNRFWMLDSYVSFMVNNTDIIDFFGFLGVSVVKSKAVAAFERKLSHNTPCAVIMQKRML